VLLAAVALLPSVLPPQWLTVAIQALLLAFGTLGLTLLAGYGGQFSIASTGLTAAGASLLAVLSIQAGLPAVLGIIGAGFFGAAIGMIIGLPALRLRGLYLLLSTLAAHFILLYFFRRYVNSQFGAYGILYDPLSIFGKKISTDTAWYYTLVPIIALIMIFVANIKHTGVGRSLYAVKQNEVAAAASGIDVPRVKLAAFVASSALTSIGGAFWGLYYLSLSSDFFTLQMAINYYAALIVGGQYFVGGAIVGCAFVAGGPLLLGELAGRMNSTWLTDHVGEVTNFVFGLAILLVLLLRPDGLWSVVEWVRGKVRRA
jgi:branched-chain amino acid transport system permease protein